MTDEIAPQEQPPADPDTAPQAVSDAPVGTAASDTAASDTAASAETSASVESAESVEPADSVESVDDPDCHRFECRSCGYVYDPGEGLKKLAIPAGTPFLSLDAATFRCPVCRSKIGAFKDIGPRNKPSGFEENLNYGLGVNRLTPGQKNVLIFGGFALAIAFFLSLYSLR
ncbi:rubredoxin [Cyanobium sp. PCC 7001]|uniref:rubredoxin n=1 Tax=Cyanobium sp. PCC 7001 TaxID=180281 RepID=UPI0001804F29|nr:rubredoxin [Cyanobium sp. PCC 7001]EDY39048.1 rubredoxin [Cyanobium sp. PCC 7001]